MSTDGNSWKEVNYYPDGRQQKALQKDFTFQNFAQALDFVNNVAKISEAQQHHPDINFGWGYARVWSTTHDAHGISDKDYQLVKSIDEIV